jgi:uncharacterized membrane protein
MNRTQNPSIGTMLLVSGAIVLIMFAISAYVWTQIPAGESVCTHWNAAGECDDYGSKFVGILLMPIITVGLAGLFALIPRIEPRAAHMAQSSKAYAVVWATLLLTFLALHTILMLDILGYDAGIDTYMPILVGLMFVLIGGSLGHVRSNYFFGIRTPWTLSSEVSWDKTHRLGGKLFVILGLILLVMPLVVTGEAWVYGLMGGILATVVVLAAYSYVIWKSDPDARAK